MIEPVLAGSTRDPIRLVTASPPIPIAQPLVGEAEERAVLEVLRSGSLAEGPRVKAFEDAFAAHCGVRHAIATSSGTTALHLALLAHGVGAGDEVITTPFTFIASANAITYVGAQPVFVDIDPRTFNLDPNLVEAAITPRTKAILPVHLFGLPANMRAIREIAERRGLVLIEDACQAHGAEHDGKRVGTFGTGCFSFYPTKNMTAAEGGMITTNNDAVAERCRVIRQHGMRRRYHHDELGFNFRMTDVHAAIGLAQLLKLDQFNERRRANARYLSSHLTGPTFPLEPSNSRHVFHQYTVRIARGQRERVREQLTRSGIGVEVYYPVPVHQQAVYREMGYEDHLPQAELASQEVLSLPVHPALTQADLERIVEGVNAAC